MPSSGYEMRSRRGGRIENFLDEIGLAYLVFFASKAFEIAPSDFVHGIWCLVSPNCCRHDDIFNSVYVPVSPRLAAVS